MNSSPSAPAAFSEVLASMAEVDRLKSREEILALEADLPARIADVTARLKVAYRQQGVAVRDETIAQGVEQFFAQRLVFQEPPPTLTARFAALWIFRRKIALGGALALAMMLAATGTVWIGVVVPAREARAQELATARQQVAGVAEKLHSMAARGADVFSRAVQELHKIAQAATDPELPKAVAVAESQLEAGRVAFEEKFKNAEEILAPFSPEGKLAYERVGSAQAAARQSADLSAAAGRKIEEVAALMQHVTGLRSERVSLETGWSRLDHAGLPAGLRATGEQVYANGLAAIAAFAPVAEAQAAAAKLHSLADAEVQLRALPERIKTAAAQARAISRDPRADEQIGTNERVGLAAAGSGDVAGAETSLGALRDITRRLGEVYTLRIVNRPREYTRLWRYPKGSTTVKNFYVVVEAIAADGAPVTMIVRSEEDGSTARVSKWAERVDEATYNAVGRDKQDDGIVQKATFGQKEKGRLTPSFEMGTKTSGGDPEAGRIYRWEYRG